MISEKKGGQKMTIGERIRDVRKSNGLTLEKFGERIGITASSMSTIESGKSNPSDQTILSIVREFKVDGNWLKTGEGDPKKPVPRSQDIDLYMNRVLNGEVTGLEEAVIRFMANTTLTEWEMLNKMLDRFLADAKDPEAKKETDD